MSNELRVGLDLDGVIIDHSSHKLELAANLGCPLELWQTNTNLIRAFLPKDAYLDLQDRLYGELTPAAPPVSGALEHLPLIKAELFIVSARRPQTVGYARRWLAEHGVLEIIPPERVVFVSTSEAKRSEVERLGISAFLDDKLRALAALPPGTRKCLFDQHGIAGRLELSAGTEVFHAWKEFAEAVAAA